MAKTEIEGLVILLDVGNGMSTNISPSITYLQSCVDIIQMIAQRKMFQSSKDELALILFGTRETANELWDGSSDHYQHVTVARPLAQVDWKLIEYIQNEISVSTLEGDILDGLVIASNHFHEDTNRGKVYKEKRIIILTDFSSNAEDDEKLVDLIAGLSKYSIRVDVIHPFDEEENDPKNFKSSTSNGHATNDESGGHRKEMSKAQKQVCKLLQQISDQTDGALFSLSEALTVLSMYQSKSVRSTGTKFTLTLGDSFKLPVVSIIQCKESKPDLFKFKKVYAKDDTVELKTDRARFTKDDEQRDLDEKADVIDAFRYGSTYVPIDNDPELLKLKVEKCFSLLGFTLAENVKRYYYLSDAVNQIMPDSAAGESVDEAFVNMVYAMQSEGVYGLGNLIL